jgi:hypothetical protein
VSWASARNSASSPGLMEAVGAALILWPRTTFWGALLLLAVCAGALVAQVGPLHGEVVHILVLALPLAVLAWLVCPPLRGLNIK